MNTAYPYTIEPEEGGGFFVQFIDIETAFTQADDLAEAAFNAEEVLSLVLSCMLDDDEEIPIPSTCPEGGLIAYPNAKVQSALLLRRARGSKSIVELATAMNTSWTSIKKLENSRNQTNLSQLERTAKALGKKLVLSLE